MRIEMTKKTTISGFVKPGFEPVQEEFAENSLNSLYSSFFTPRIFSLGLISFLVFTPHTFLYGTILVHPYTILYHPLTGGKLW